MPMSQQSSPLRSLRALLPSFGAIFVGISVVFALATSCAKRATPEGGPYDMVPPRLIKSTPPNGSVQVSPKKIKLRFNENVKIERQSEKVVFTPPQLNLPKIESGTGKTITIRFEDPLLPNTTYVIDFSDAIVDLNEGNPIENFSYAFSTGDVIDTMAVSGLVIDAHTLLPVPNLSVGIYKDFQVSHLSKKPALRLTRSTDLGDFLITHAAPGKYRIFAFDDIDRSYNYTGASEGLAFLDEEVEAKIPPIAPPPAKPLLSDSTHAASDTLAIEEVVPEAQNSLAESSRTIESPSVEDTPTSSIQGSMPKGENTFIPDSLDVAEPDSSKNVNHPEKREPSAVKEKRKAPDILLLYSRSQRPKLVLQKSERPDSTRLRFTFTSPIDTLPLLTPLFNSPQVKPNTVRAELNDARTELIYWLTDSALYRQDTLRFEARYWVTDSLYQLVPKIDSLTFSYRRPAPKARVGGLFSRQKDKKKQKTSSRADTIGIATDSASIANQALVDSVPPPPKLTATILPQEALRRGFPSEPFFVEFSEIPAVVDTVHLRLYTIAVDSATLVPEEAEPASPEKKDSHKESRPEQIATQKDTFTGGAADPYQDPQERYGKPTENEVTEEPETPKDTPSKEVPKGERKPIPFVLEPDSLHARRYQITFEPAFATQYLLVIDSAAMKGVYGAVSDSLELPFNTLPESGFGSILLHIDSIPRGGRAYFELLTESDSILMKMPLTDSLFIKNLSPATYYGRTWVDLNGNGVWDGGSFPRKQPEPTYYCPAEMLVRSKFVNKLHWKIGADPLYLQRPSSMKVPEEAQKGEERRERIDQNIEYVHRMRERYGEKWNPSNHDRKILGLPSRKEERETKRAEKEAEQAEREAKGKKAKKPKNLSVAEPK